MISITFCNIVTFFNIDPRELSVTPTGEGSRNQKSERGSIAVFGHFLSCCLYSRGLYSAHIRLMKVRTA